MKTCLREKIIWVLLIFSVLFMVGCKSNHTSPSSSVYGDKQHVELTYEGELTFTGLEEEFAVAYNDIFQMDSVTRDVKHTSSSGEESVETVTGVLLDSLLEKKGVAKRDYEIIRFIAADGYAIDIASDILQEKEIILAYQFNDTYLDEKKQPLRVAIHDVRSMYYVANLSVIEFLRGNQGDKSGEQDGQDKVIILETAANSIGTDIYTYYDSEDQAVQASELLHRYVKQESNTVTFIASDGLEKSEDVSVIREGYIKVTGKNSPLFLVPDLPKGMHVKYILTLQVGDTLFASALQGIKTLEQRTIDDKTGVALDAFMTTVGLDGDYYTLTSADGYQVEVSKQTLENGIIHEGHSGQYHVTFDDTLPESSGLSNIISIEIGDGTHAIDHAQQEDAKTDVEVSHIDQEVSWTIMVEGLSDGSFELTHDRAKRKLNLIPLHTERLKNDKKKLEDWEGYRVSEVLEFLKVTTYHSLLIEANDGFQVELQKDEIDGETILAVVKDNKPLADENNKVQLVQNTEFSTTWVKGVSKIIVK